MKLNFKSYILLGATLAFAASCSESNWEPGPQDTNANGVFFTGLDQYSYVIEPDDNHLITVTLGRTDNSQAITVPLKTLSDIENVPLPESVSFAAGEETTSFVIDLSGMATKTTGSIRMAVDPAYASVYGAGSSNLELNINMTGAWIPISENVKVKYSGTYSYSTQYTQLYILDGTEQFKIPNFLNSGVDLFFNLEFTSNDYPSVMPYKNVQWYAQLFPDDDDSYECWYLYDDATGLYPVWSPDGSSPLISDCMWYGLGYTYLGISQGYGYFLGATTYDDGSEGWLYATLTFDALFDPFAPDNSEETAE